VWSVSSKVRGLAGQQSQSRRGKKKAGHDGKVFGLLNGTTERKKHRPKIPQKTKRRFTKSKNFSKIKKAICTGPKKFSKNKKTLICGKKQNKWRP